MHLDYWKPLYSAAIAPQQLRKLRRRIVSDHDIGGSLADVLSFIDILIIASPLSDSARRGVEKLVSLILTEPYATLFYDFYTPPESGSGTWYPVLTYCLDKTAPLPDSWGLIEGDLLRKQLDELSSKKSRVTEATLNDFSDFLSRSAEGTRAVENHHVWDELPVSPECQLSMAYCVLSLTHTKATTGAFDAAEKWARIDKSKNVKGTVPGVPPLLHAQLAIKVGEVERAKEILRDAFGNAETTEEKYWYLHPLLSNTELLRLISSAPDESLWNILPSVLDDEDFVRTAVQNINEALDIYMGIGGSDRRDDGFSWEDLLERVATAAFTAHKEEFEEIGVANASDILRPPCHEQDLQHRQVAGRKLPQDIEAFLLASNGFRGTPSFSNYGIGPLSFLRRFKQYDQLFMCAVMNQQDAELLKIDGIIEIPPYAGDTEDESLENTNVKHLLVFPDNVRGPWWDDVPSDQRRENYIYVQFDVSDGEMKAWKSLRVYLEELLEHLEQ